MISNHKKKIRKTWKTRVTSTDNKPSGLKALRRALIVVIAGLVFAWSSPYFVAEESVKRTFGSLLGGLIGMDYPKSGAQPIVVVTVDDDDLHHTGDVWPISYQYHADVLKRLALLGSKRIMVDILFVDERKDPTLPAFKATLCALKKQGVEVFIASQRLDNGGVYLRPGLAELAAPMASPDKACFTAVTVGTRLDSYDQRAWTYSHDAEESSQPRPESAAFAIYKSIHPEIHLPEADLAILWGTVGSEFNMKWMRKPAKNGASSVAHCKAWTYPDLLPSFLRPGSIFNPDAADNRPVCPYHMTIPVRALQDYPGSNPFGHLEDGVRGATVFYGASLLGTQDIIESPVHGSIPGVHLHAMALDNLLNFNQDYLLAQEFSIAHWSAPATLMTILCVALIAALDVLLNIIHNARSKRASLGDKFITWGMKVSLVLLSCIVLYMIGRHYFRLGPLSWIEFALAPMVLELLDKADDIDERVGHFWEWITRTRPKRTIK